MLLNLSEPLESRRRELIEQGMAEKTGVVRADFNQSQGNIVVIEYDPYVTSPTELHRHIKDLSLAADPSTLFLNQLPAGEDDETS
jgi:tetrahydromethanopterin S-methyltransferase subunit B